MKTPHLFLLCFYLFSNQAMASGPSVKFYASGYLLPRADVSIEDVEVMEWKKNAAHLGSAAGSIRRDSEAFGNALNFFFSAFSKLPGSPWIIEAADVEKIRENLVGQGDVREFLSLDSRYRDGSQFNVHFVRAETSRHSVRLPYLLEVVSKDGSRDWVIPPQFLTDSEVEAFSAQNPHLHLDPGTGASGIRLEVKRFQTANRPLSFRESPEETASKGPMIVQTPFPKSDLAPCQEKLRMIFESLPIAFNEGVGVEVEALVARKDYGFFETIREHFSEKSGFQYRLNPDLGDESVASISIGNKIKLAEVQDFNATEIPFFKNKDQVSLVYFDSKSFRLKTQAFLSGDKCYLPNADQFSAVFKQFFVK